MKLDTRFLSPPPETKTWWAQRDVCRACAHHSDMGGTQSGSGSLGERCKVTTIREMGAVEAYETHTDMARPAKGVRPKQARRFPRSEIWAYCIDARLPGAKCGPGAKLYEPKVETVHLARALPCAA